MLAVREATQMHVAADEKFGVNRSRDSCDRLVDPIGHDDLELVGVVDDPDSSQI